MWATSKVLLTFGVLFLFLNGLTGCSGGGISLIVSDIQGPTALDELAYSEYSVEVTSGTNITYQWYCNPADAGEFYPAEFYETRFTAYETQDDKPVEIWVIVNSDEDGPIIKRMNITVRAIPGISVSEILGPYEAAENSSEAYRVLASGDTGFEYEWSANIPEICIFTEPGSSETEIDFGDVPKDTCVEINVQVLSDSQQFFQRSIVVKIVAETILFLGGISGVKEITEWDTAQYSVELLNPGDASLEWVCDPPEAGGFEPPDTTTTVFSPSPLCFDTPVTIRVIAYLGDEEIARNSYGISIIDVPTRWVNIFETTYSGEIRSHDVDVDSEGNICIMGFQNGVVDFDPGPGEQIIDSNGYYIAKFNPDGEFIWVRTFLRGINSWASAITIDNSNNIYITGYFYGACDFDPGEGTDYRTSFEHVGGGYGDALFICKYDAEGNLQFAYTWGGDYIGDKMVNMGGSDIYADDYGDVYVTGYYRGPIDFDPGVEEFWLQSTLTWGGTHYFHSKDTFVSKFDSQDIHVWTRGFDGKHDNTGFAVIRPANDGVYVAGHFGGDIDLDPNYGEIIFEAEHTSTDTFLVKLDTGGYYEWGQVWGGGAYYTLENKPYALTSNHEGHIFITGHFSGAYDFDPGPGELLLDSSEGGAFLAEFTPLGESVRATNWGSIDTVGHDVKVDDFGNVFTVCSYLIAKRDADFNIIWEAEPGARGMALDIHGHVYSTGYLHGPMDFDPGICFDWLEDKVDYYNDAFLSMLPSDGRW